jgi:hypothetical protein
MPFNINYPGYINPNSCNHTGLEIGYKSTSTIKYIGPNLPGTGVQVGDDLTTVIQKIDSKIVEIMKVISDTPSTSTSTTTLI